MASKRVTAQAAHIELCRRSPIYWRNNLVLHYDRGEPVLWGGRMSEIQVKDFNAMDGALKYVGGLSYDRGDWHKLWIQRTRGYSKSTDVASSLCWPLAFGNLAWTGIIGAGDRDQAAQLRDRLNELLQYNEWMKEFIDVQSKALVGKKSGARIDIISTDSHTSYGATPMVVVLSEFCNWPSGAQHQGFYTSAISSFAKRADSGAVLIVETNAGYGKGWQYDAMNAARTSPDWYFSAPHSYAPWYSEATVNEQRKFLTESEFKRLWLNEWQSADGSFISLEEAEACIDPSLTEQRTGIPGFLYVATIDVGLKNDRTVMTVMHLINGCIIIDRQDVFDPSMFENNTIPIEIVEHWMLEVARSYDRVIFVPDQYQMVSIIRKFEGILHIEPFDFKGGVNNWRMSYTFRQLVMAKRIKWYPGCGTMIKDGLPYQPFGTRDDLCTELAALEVKMMPTTGRWRFDHVPGRHDDRAFGVGAGVLFIVENTADVFQDIVSDDPSQR